MDMIKIIRRFIVILKMRVRRRSQGKEESRNKIILVLVDCLMKIMRRVKERERKMMKMRMSMMRKRMKMMSLR